MTDQESDQNKNKKERLHEAICRGCLQFYTKTDRRPIILPCTDTNGNSLGHTLCLKCLEEQISTSREGKIQCQEDDIIYSKKDYKDIYSLPKNERIKDKITRIYNSVNRLENETKYVNYALAGFSCTLMILQIVYSIVMWSTVVFQHLQVTQRCHRIRTLPFYDSKPNLLNVLHILGDFLFQLAFVVTPYPSGLDYEKYTTYFIVIFALDLGNFSLTTIVLLLLKRHVKRWERKQKDCKGQVLIQRLITKNTIKYSTIFPYRDDEESELIAN